ncbi:MAG: aminotransferase class I/II-fold pyridoxal phosphate-dependent enzyme [Deltaproteobacteria bacterium]|jgi:aminotransferase|nr:aminotransferase class I/II-fold pyridoxal phosphate-dependent enzyme [Deltaproteobacteria bacterium]
MQPLSARAAGFTDSMIRRMTRVSLRHAAVNLSQGFPDTGPPEAVVQRLIEVARAGPHQYSITWGAANFRQALAEKQSRLMGWEIDPEQEIVVTCGATEAMMAAMLTVVDPGDKVAVFSPFYENYGADAILAGAEPLYVPLSPPDFALDQEALEAVFARRPKALILCNPSNPCGRVFTLEELSAIAGLARRYDAYVLTDEVYEHIVYPPHRHIYFASLPGMRERTLSCSSLSKTYSMTGWRLGYIIAPPDIAEAARKVHDFLTVGAPAPLQEAAVAGLRLPEAYYRDLAEGYRDKRDFFLQGLDEIGLSHNTPQGTYYVLVDVSAFGQEDDVAFCEALAARVGVGAVPGCIFFQERASGLIRLHFARQRPVLEETLRRLAGIGDKI